MEFEFDVRKSEVNKQKHGIDFVTAQALWLDEDGIELPARNEAEPRWVLIGMIAGEHWAAFFTIREGRVRLISARKARRREVMFYESEGS